MARGYQSTPFPVPPPRPSQRHGKKPTHFLAESVFGSHWGVMSSSTGSKRTVEAHDTGEPGGEGTHWQGEIAHRVLWDWALLWWGMVEAWGCSAGALLSSHARTTRIRSAESKRAGIASGTAYLSAQCSSQPFFCVPSPERAKTVFIWHKMVGLPLMDKLQLEEKHHLQKAYSCKSTANCKSWSKGSWVPKVKSRKLCSALCSRSEFSSLPQLEPELEPSLLGCWLWTFQQGSRLLLLTGCRIIHQPMEPGHVKEIGVEH